MATDDPTLVERIRAKCPALGAALWTISSPNEQRAPRSVSLEQLLGEAGDDAEAQQLLLEGALAILYAMGVVRLAADDIAAMSRNAGYFLGSLSRFLDQSVQAINDPLDRLHEYSRLTRIYETARLRWDRAQEVNQQSLHHCHVVNVVVKGEMIRDWQRKPVYLHVYHPEWKGYHLIGLGVDGSPDESRERDKEVAKEALRRHLRLEPSQYEFDDTIKEELVPLDRISATSGAYTHYTYRVFVVHKIGPPLRREDRLRDEYGTFRWFTWDEMEQELSNQREAIMFSTPHVMKRLKVYDLPVSTCRADDLRAETTILEELGRRFTRRQLTIVPVTLVILLAIQSFPWVLTQLGRPNPALENLAHLARIVYVAVTLFGGGLIAAVPGLLKRDAAH